MIHCCLHTYAALLQLHSASLTQPAGNQAGHKCSDIRSSYLVVAFQYAFSFVFKPGPQRPDIFHVSSPEPSKESVDNSQPVSGYARRCKAAFFCYTFVFLAYAV